MCIKGCTLCVDVCPLDSLAIHPDAGKAYMHVDECWYRGPCATRCPTGAVTVNIPSCSGERTSMRTFLFRSLALVSITGLAEQNDEWTEARRYIGLDLLAKSRLSPLTDTSDNQEETTQTITA